jgi:hypothetical protein
MKAMIGDSLQSAEFWALAPVLTLIAEGGLSDVQCLAVAACYVAFVAGRVLLKSKGIAEVAATTSKVAPLLLVCVLLTGCAQMREWFDSPATQPSEPTPVVVEGVGTVTLEPEPEPVTKGDAIAAGAGEIVGAATGVGLLGLLVAKGLGAFIGSRRKKVQA